MVVTLGNDASSYAAIKIWMVELSIRFIRLISFHQTFIYFQNKIKIRYPLVANDVGEFSE